MDPIFPFFRKDLILILIHTQLLGMIHELVKINGGTPFSTGNCEDYMDLSLTVPEPGRYCLANQE